MIHFETVQVVFWSLSSAMVLWWLIRIIKWIMSV